MAAGVWLKAEAGGRGWREAASLVKLGRGHALTGRAAWVLGEAETFEKEDAGFRRLQRSTRRIVLKRNGWRTLLLISSSHEGSRQKILQNKNNNDWWSWQHNHTSQHTDCHAKYCKFTALNSNDWLEDGLASEWLGLIWTEKGFCISENRAWLPPQYLRVMWDVRKFAILSFKKTTRKWRHGWFFKRGSC